MIGPPTDSLLENRLKVQQFRFLTIQIANFRELGGNLLFQPSGQGLLSFDACPLQFAVGLSADRLVGSLLHRLRGCGAYCRSGSWRLRWWPGSHNRVSLRVEYTRRLRRNRWNPRFCPLLLQKLLLCCPDSSKITLSIDLRSHTRSDLIYSGSYSVWINRASGISSNRLFDVVV